MCSVTDGGFFNCSAREGSWLPLSESEREDTTRDLIRVKHSNPLPYFSGDAWSGKTGYESGQNSLEDASGVNALGTTQMVSPPAECHANRYSCRSAQDMASSWDALVGSLPSFHGVGWAEEQGKRSEMEDGTVVIRDFGGMPGAWLLAIYDGHGGRATVSLLLQRLHDNLLHQLQERGDKRWKSLKKKAQYRRSLLADSLEPQQKRLRAQRRRMRQLRQQGLRVKTNRGMHFREHEGNNISKEMSDGTQTYKHFMPDSHYSQQLEDEILNHAREERLHAYWKLLRTHQLIRVLRWMEDSCVDPSVDVQNDADSCLSPHYLLVCTEEDVRSALSDAFRQTDEELLHEGIVQSGATACVSLLRPSIDFQRLVTMDPDDFTDQDWLLFSGNPISFPSEEEEKRRGEGNFTQHEGRRMHSAGGVWSASASHASAAAGGAVSASTTGGNIASPPSSEAEPDVEFTGGDVVSRTSKQHDEVPYAVSGNVCPAVCSSVGAPNCVHHSTEKGQKTEKTPAMSSLLSMKLSVAHLGDSRALLVALDGSCERLTAATDHKASSFQEVLRVEEAGGWVFGERVNGMLAIGRAFGDWCLKLNPEELRVFSGPAQKKNNGEQTEGCDEVGRTGKTGTEEDMAGDCEASIVDKAFLQTMRDGLGGLVSNALDSDTCSRVNVAEEGARVNQQGANATEKRLTGSQPRRDTLPVRRRGRSLAGKHFSSRKHTLVVSNEPHICTRDLLAYQGSVLAKDSATAAANTSDDGIGTDVAATTTGDTLNAQSVSGGCPARSGGLTSPPALLLLGCDGLFDVCSDDAVTAIALEFLRELQETHPDLTPSDAAQAVARALIEEAITFRGSTDNVSVTVALLLPMDFCGSEDVCEG